MNYYWDTPFKTALFPSVLLYTKEGINTSMVYVLVSPSGIDKYPKYRIDFGEVVSFISTEEACTPKTLLPEDEPFSKEVCSYAFDDTESAKTYQFIFNKKAVHYIILGGDNVIQVLTTHEPVIERVDE